MPADGSPRTAGTTIFPQRAVDESGQGVSVAACAGAATRSASRPASAAASHNGMFPCRRFGRSTRLVSAVSSASISTGRVRDGRITSST